jgi:large conductance mechanosensitive channel
MRQVRAAARQARNRMERKEEAAPAAPVEEIVLLREIRDSLRRPVP